MSRIGLDLEDAEVMEIRIRYPSSVGVFPATQRTLMLCIEQECSIVCEIENEHGDVAYKILVDYAKICDAYSKVKVDKHD